MVFIEFCSWCSYRPTADKEKSASQTPNKANSRIYGDTASNEVSLSLDMAVLWQTQHLNITFKLWYVWKSSGNYREGHNQELFSSLFLLINPRTYPLYRLILVSFFSENLRACDTKDKMLKKFQFLHQTNNSSGFPSHRMQLPPLGLCCMLWWEGPNQDNRKGKRVIIWEASVSLSIANGSSQTYACSLACPNLRAGRKQEARRWIASGTSYPYQVKPPKAFHTATTFPLFCPILFSPDPICPSPPPHIITTASPVMIQKWKGDKVCHKISKMFYSRITIEQLTINHCGVDGP